MKISSELKTGLVILSCLFATACAHPFFAMTRSPASPDKPQNEFLFVDGSLSSDLKTLEDILRSRIVPLDRDMVTFNYQSGESFTPRSLVEVQMRLTNGWAERYFDPRAIDVDMGPGQYAAMDPFSSRWYGREKPQLYVITIAKGALILDVTKKYKGSEQAVLEDMYKRLDCAKAPADGGPISRSRRLPLDFNDMVGRLRTSASENCRRLMIRAAQDLGIHAILYGLESVGTLAECRSSRDQAIDLIRHEAIRLEDVAYYDEVSKFEAKPFSAYIARLYRESTLDPVFRKRYKLSSIEILGGLKGSTVDDSSYASWKRRSIYRCGPPWFSESEDEFNDFNEFLNSAYGDRRLLEDLAAANDAFVRRFSGSSAISGRRLDFEPSRLNEVERLQFTADASVSGWDFKEWKNRVDSSVVSVRDLAAYVKNIKIPIGGDRRGVVADFYLRSDATLARSRLNSWVFAVNGIPFLTGPLPRASESERDVDRLVQANREVYKRILSQCVALYADPQRSDSEIQDGPCGIRPWPARR